jgi:hypothetical protein
MITLLFIIQAFAKSSNYDPQTMREWITATEKFYYGFAGNRGQLSEEVLLYSKNSNFNIYITKEGLSFVIYANEKTENQKEPKILYSRIDCDLIGGNIKKENITFENEIPNYYENYYTQYAPDGILFVRLYKKVRIKEVYPGIDWILRYDEEGNFHHEFEARPNSNIDQIKIKVRNAEIELIDEGRSALLKTSIGIIKDGNLIAYEGKKEISAKYTIKDNLLSFEIKNYEGREKLLIDPHALVWGTYYGGSNWNNDAAYSISTDANGNVFVVGGTYSTDFPTYDPGGGAYFDGTCGTDGNCNYDGSNYYWDAFILKFTNSGVRLWATYYGGSGSDYASSISTDANGNVFVVGYTSSTDFPTYDAGGGAYYQGTNAGWYDAFILKFTNNGIRLWATYYGGSSYDYAYSISTDANGNAFVFGETGSTNFPTYNPGGGAYYQGTNAGLDDAFILKFNNSGVRLWATYYGGNDYDYASSISTDANGNVFVVGYTYSTNFPTLNPGGGAYYQGTKAGLLDAFILKFNNSGVRLWATYYGGNNGNGATSISTDADGNVFVVGGTYSTNFPTYDPGGGAYYQPNNAGYSDAFILKFSGSTSIPESFISSIKIKNNNVIIKLNENINGEFKVFTILGREIIRGRINNNEISFKVPSSGIYILKVNNKNVKIVVK